MAKDDISQYIEYLKTTPAGHNPDDLSKYESYLRSQPGMSEGNPKSVDMFPGADTARIGIGFGDKDNAAYQGYKQGFKNPHLDSDGNLVAQDAKGHYVKDATNFWPNQMNKTPVTDLSSAAQAAKEIMSSSHPLNWTEANLGPALRGAGWLAGASAGGTLGAFSGPFAPAIGTAGATVGAGIGEGAGEELRQDIGRAAGVYHATDNSPQSQSDVVSAMNHGALSELGGRAIGGTLGYVGEHIPMPESWGGNATDAVKNGVSRLISMPSWAAMGGSVPWADAARVVKRPQGVSAAAEKGFGLRTAEKMESELGENVGIAKQKIQQAQDEFRSQFGGSYPDMTKPVDGSLDFIDRHTPTAMNPESRLTPQERMELLHETLKMDNANAGTLLTQSQRLSESLPGKVYDGSTSQRGDLTTGQLKRMSGGIKGVLHDLDPHGLGAADAEFSSTMNKASTLRPIEGENQEGVVNNLWGKNSTARQEAARDLTPNTYNNELLDLRSRQAFDEQGLLGATPKDAWTKAGVAGLMGEAVTHSGSTSPETMGIIAAILAGQSPKVNYYGLQGAGRLLQHAPQAELYSRMPQSPWNFSKENKQ